MQKQKDINIIVATSTNYGIGYDNKMCWNIPEELNKFKEITTEVIDKTKKNCIIMGKNTWYSLPKKPLINRINIIKNLMLMGINLISWQKIKTTKQYGIQG